MSKKISPSERLKEIKEAPGKLRESDYINEYLEEEAYITVVEEKNGRRKYEVTDHGNTILSKLDR